jgi:hypothetical protein
MEYDNLDDFEIEVIPERIKQEIQNDDYILSEIPDYVLDDEDILEIKKRRDNYMKINDEKLNMENERMLREMERKIDAEIKKELETEFEPLNILEDHDKQRARELINTEPLIQKAVGSNIVTLEEIIFFLDYYEIFSLINKTKRRAIDTLNELTNLFVEDNGIDPIRQNIENTLNINNSVLDIDFDYSKLKLDNSTFLTANSVPRAVNTKLVVETKTKPELKQTVKENSKTGFSSRSRYQSLPKINKQNNKLTSSIELFNNEKPVNLLTIRDNRRDMKKPGFKSKENDLFKFDTKNIIVDSKEDIRKQFLEVFDLKKTWVESVDKKNTILKRIDDARNYFKNKL